MWLFYSQIFRQALFIKILLKWHYSLLMLLSQNQPHGSPGFYCRSKARANSVFRLSLTSFSTLRISVQVKESPHVDITKPLLSFSFFKTAFCRGRRSVLPQLDVSCFVQAHGNSAPHWTGHKKQDPCHICNIAFHYDARQGHQLQGVFDSSQREDN